MRTHTTLTLTLVHDGPDAADKTIRSLLDFMVEHAAGNGMFTGDADMVVDSWDHTIETGDTFRVTAKGQPDDDESSGLSKGEAQELFHRMHGRGLGIKVVNENTGEILERDPPTGE